MVGTVRFRGKKYKLIITRHAFNRMESRGITRSILVHVIEKGTAKRKPHKKDKYWVYLNVEGRIDNQVCVSVSIEEPNLIVITALIHWSPGDEN